MGMAVFEFHVTLNDDDFCLFNEYVVSNDPAWAKSINGVRVMAVIVSAAFIGLVWMGAFHPAIKTIITIVVALLSVAFVNSVKSGTLKSVRRNIDKQKEAGRLPYSKEATFFFEEDCVYETTPENETKSGYDIIEKVVETDRFVYVFVSVSSAHIIPVTAFADDAEKHSFLAFIESKHPN